MKKTSVLLAFALIMLSVFAFSATAFAADYEHCADALKEMGLFKGGASGYELDRQATRAEAAVMLVRLLGAEQEALTGEYSHPFTDLEDWASPYIGYMYETGLTKGASDTTFNPQGICDLQMFSAFTLRALGYGDDFEYAEATDFAMSLGVVDIINSAGIFERDNLAAIAYTALFVPTKDTETILLEQLIEAGAVDKDAATPYLELFSNYGAMQAANLKLSEAGKAPVEMKIFMDMDMDIEGEGSMNMVYEGLLKMDVAAIADTTDIAKIIAALDKIKFALSSKINVSGELMGEEATDLAFDIYLLDGVAYLNMDLSEIIGSDEFPSQISVELETVLAMVNLEDLGLQEMIDRLTEMTNSLMPGDPYAPHYNISNVKGIEVTALAAGETSYVVSYLSPSDDLLQAIAGQIYGGMPDVMEVMEATAMETIIDEYIFTLDKDGGLKKMDMSLQVNQTIFADTEDAVTSKTAMKMSMEITKTGKDVKITLPGKAADYVDLFELINSMMAAPMPEPMPEYTIENL